MARSRTFSYRALLLASAASAITSGAAQATNYTVTTTLPANTSGIPSFTLSTGDTFSTTPTGNVSVAPGSLLVTPVVDVTGAATSISNQGSLTSTQGGGVPAS